MKENEIHPRVLERIRQVQQSVGNQLLDRQVTAYAQLCKATKVLRESRFEDKSSGRRETQELCSSAAETVRRLATEGTISGDIYKLEEVCERLGQLAGHICEGWTGADANRACETRQESTVLKGMLKSTFQSKVIRNPNL